MEGNQELKHVCKFCSKRFGCGRSLGGHMRSHMINDISAQSDGTKLTRKKLPSLDTFINNNNRNNNNNNNIIIINNNNNTTSTETTTTPPTAYGLRENPKKTWRLKNHSSTEDTSSQPFDKSCKECGKSFSSWKALFGHMKCHSVEKERLFNANNSLEEHQDSWTSGNNDQKLVMDSQSDNETATPNRKKRSKRRTRYMVTANSSSLSFADNKNNNNNNPSSSASEIEQEQEEVAMCLILLSRDVGQWGGFNSVAESSDNNSVFLETNQVNPKFETKNSLCNGSENQKLKEHIDKNCEIGKLEPGSCELTKNLATFDEAEMGSSKYNPSKRKLQSCAENSESMSDSLKKLTTDLVDNKSSKFECATCNKVFYSYQALGGHRASHKKIKGCFASKIDSSENSIDTEVTPDQVTATDSNLDKIITDAVNIDQLITENDNKGETRKSRAHECPICLRVFPSGQALGGHKRSHLVVGAIEAKNNGNQTIKIEEPMPGIRDFLDLNLPAPDEEDSNGIAGFNPWWIPSTHKLISNQVL